MVNGPQLEPPLAGLDRGVINNRITAGGEFGPRGPLGIVGQRVTTWWFVRAPEVIVAPNPPRMPASISTSCELCLADELHFTGPPSFRASRQVAPQEFHSQRHTMHGVQVLPALIHQGDEAVILHLTQDIE